MSQPGNDTNIDKVIEAATFPFSIQDFSNKSFIEDLLVVLTNKVSILPELTSVIKDPAVLFELLYIFAGQTLEFPEAKVLYNAVRDLDIYYCIQKNNTSQEVNRLATKYSLTFQTVGYVANKMALSFGRPLAVK